MKPYETLSVAAQARRIRRIAKAALPAFGLRPSTPFRLLHHGENTTFRVDASRDRRFNLRVHRAGYQGDREIESELLWMQALARDTHLVVPEPVEGVDGKLLQHGETHGVPARRAVTLLRWVPGRFLSKATVAGHHRIGVLSAHLHEHGLSWRRPKRFDRRTWDAEGLLGESAHFGWVMDAPMPAATRRLVERTVDRLWSDLEVLGKREGEFGLIHADMHLWNIATNDKVACPIDFDDCGFGWLAYDWAVVMTPSLADPNAEAAKAAWLDGYASVRPFPEAQREAFDLMVTTRAVAMLGWIAARLDNARLRAYLPTRLKIVRARARAYLDGKPQTSVRW